MVTYTKRVAEKRMVLGSSEYDVKCTKLFFLADVMDEDPAAVPRCTVGEDGGGRA